MNYKCLNCNAVQCKMSDIPVEDVAKCRSCLKKEDDIKNPVKFIVDGAPTGFVKGGVSNKAGFSTGKIFNGN